MRQPHVPFRPTGPSLHAGLISVDRYRGIAAGSRTVAFHIQALVVRSLPLYRGSGQQKLAPRAVKGR